MRPIDADELKKKAYPFPCAIGVEYAVTLRAIDEAPTVDAETVRPGRWIPVAERLPDNASHPGALCTQCMVMTKYGVTEGWYNPDRESWFLLFWYIKPRFHERDIDFVRGDIPRLVKVPLHNGIVSAWMPLPEPYEPEEDKQCGKEEEL